MQNKKQTIGWGIALWVAVLIPAPMQGQETVNPEAALQAYLDSIARTLDLEEVVVTGQGGQIKKRRLSSNVQLLNGKELQHLPTQRLDQMLQTALPNMKINLSGGQPGSTSLMWARGLSSAYSNSTPVIYVDGVRVDNQNTASALTNDLNGGNHTQGYEGQTSSNSSLGDIPMENIERIEFVPGGAATTLYGSDAANGVIHIFTLKGGSERFSGSAAIELGAETATADFYRFERTKHLLHQTGMLQRYRLQMEGTSDKGGWSLGASMGQQEGVIVGNAQEQKYYNLRLGMHHNLNSWIEFQSTWGASFQNLRYARNGNEGLYSGLWSIECGDFGYADNDQGLKTLYPLSYRDKEGNWQRYFQTTNVDELNESDYQLLKQLCYQGESLSDHRDQIRRFQTSQALIAKPLKGMTLKAVLGLDYRNNFNKYTITNQWLEATGQARYLTQSSMRNYERNYLGLTFDASVQYDYRRDWLSAITTAGFQFFSTDDHQSTEMGKNLRDGVLTLNGAASKTADEWLSYLYNYGFFAQENFGFLDRYYLDLGLRADYNSAFGDNVGWQLYPKVGLSYMLSEEPLLRDVEWLTTLRLLANYGVAGLYPPAYAYQRTIGLSSFLGEQAATFDQYGNDDLGPEKKHSKEIGFNLGVLDNRLSLGLTYYHSITRDAIFNVPLAPSVGEGYCLKNVGKIENSGIEMNLALHLIHTREWDLMAQASLNTNRNEVLSNGGTPTFAIGGFSTSSIQSVVSEGESVGYLRGSRATLLSDGTVQIDKLQNLGNTLPTCYGALGLSFRWKNLTLFANGDYQLGGHVHSYDAQFRFRNGIKDERIPDELLEALGMAPDGSNRWKVQKSNWTNVTNYFVYSSDFLKVRQIGFDYRFDVPRQHPLHKALKGGSIGFVANNPWHITSCPVDPEATISTTLSQGAVAVGGFNYATYSTPRQFIVNLKVNF